MTLTYIPIASTTLSTSAATVTFSDIPQTYSDLVLRCSIRGTHTGFTVNGQLVINNSSTSNITTRYLYGFGTSATSSEDGPLNYLLIKETIPGTSITSNTFNSLEIYIPNYAGSTNKPFSVSSVTENNSSTINAISAQAGLRTNTAAITELRIQPGSGNLESGSTFHLYGII